MPASDILDARAAEDVALKLACAGLVTVLVLLASDAQADPNSLPLGLDALHWDMSPSQARAAFPQLSNDNRALGIFAPTNLPALFLHDYRYDGCTFYGEFYFEEASFKLINLTTIGPCDTSRVAKDFSKHFGVPEDNVAKDSPTRALPGKYGSYQGTVTAARYQDHGDHIDIYLSDAAHPALNYWTFTMTKASSPPPKSGSPDSH
jgi:hypothetical protein